MFYSGYVYRTLHLNGVHGFAALLLEVDIWRYCSGFVHWTLHVHGLNILAVLL